MKDIESVALANDGTTEGTDSGLRAAIQPLVRLLARQAAREDYERALEATRAKPYSTERVKARKSIEDN